MHVRQLTCTCTVGIFVFSNPKLTCNHAGLHCNANGKSQTVISFKLKYFLSNQEVHVQCTNYSSKQNLQSYLFNKSQKILYSRILTLSLYGDNDLSFPDHRFRIKFAKITASFPPVPSGFSVLMSSWYWSPENIFCVTATKGVIVIFRITHSKARVTREVTKHSKT